MRSIAAIVMLLVAISSAAVAALPEGWLGADDTGSAAVSARIDQPPIVDGSLDDPAWMGSASATGFVLVESTQPAGEQTAVRFTHDAKTLYLAAVVADAKIVAAQRPRDKGTWDDDCIEIFLDPQRVRQDRFHLIVSAAGSIYDASLNDAKWNANPDVTVAARVVPNQGWVVELAIPFAALGVSPPQRGEVWDLKLAREDYIAMGGSPRLSSWRYAGKSFSDAGAFGRLVFETPNAAVNGDVADGLREGRWCNGSWRRSSKAPGAIELETAAGHDAAPCVRAVVEGYTQIQSCVPVTPMRNYRVIAWVNLDGIGETIRLDMYHEKNSAVAADRRAKGWQRLETFVAMGAGKFLPITFTMSGAKGIVLIDDLSVEEIDNVPRGEGAVCYTANAVGAQARHNRAIPGRYTYTELGTSAAFFPQGEERGAADVEKYADWIDFSRGALTDGKPTFSQYHQWTMDPGKTLLVDLGSDVFITDIEIEPVERRLRDVRVWFRPDAAARWTLVADHPDRTGTLQVTDLDAHTRHIAIDYAGEPGLRELRLWGRDESEAAAPRAVVAPLSKDPAAGQGGSALADASFAIFPTPKQVTLRDGVMPLRHGLRIALPADASETLRNAAKNLAEQLAFRAAVRDIAVDSSNAGDIRLSIGQVEGGEEGYRLTIDPKGAVLIANSDRGLIHATHSLIQCVTAASAGPALRSIDVADWPRYSFRAIQLWDRQLRDPALRRIVDAIARMKINQLILMGGDSETRKYCATLVARGMDTVPRCADMPASAWFRSVIELNPGETIKDLPSLARVNPCPSNPKTYELIAGEIERIRGYPGRYAYINCDEMYQDHKGARWNVCDLCTARKANGGDLFAQLIAHIHAELKKIGKTPVMLDTMYCIPWKMQGGFEQLPKDIPVAIWHPQVQKGLTDLGFPVIEFLDGDTWSIDPRNSNVQGAFVPGDGGLKLEKYALWAEALWTGNYPDATDPAMLRRLSDQMSRVHEATIGAPLPSQAASPEDFSTIDLSTAGNATLADSAAGDGAGLLDLGPGSDMTFMRGKHTLAGVPFAIGDSIAVVESAGSLDDRFAEEVVLSINRRAGSLLFLHALTRSLPWTYSMQSSYAGSYIITYDDGSRVDYPILYKTNILELNALGARSHGYKSKLVTVSAAFPGYAGALPSGDSVLLMAGEWVNPFPDRTIRSVTMRATSRYYGSRTALFALTATKPVPGAVTPAPSLLPPVQPQPDLGPLREIDLTAGTFDAETKYTAPNGAVLEASSAYTLHGATFVQPMHVGFVTVDNNLGWQVYGEKPQHLTVTFPSPRPVAGVALLGLPESPEYIFEHRISGFDYDIAVSSDGSTWQPVAARTRYVPDRDGPSAHIWPAQPIRALRITLKPGPRPAGVVRGLARLWLYEPK